jgi:hypothetical protein
MTKMPDYWALKGVNKRIWLVKRKDIEARKNLFESLCNKVVTVPSLKPSTYPENTVMI